MSGTPAEGNILYLGSDPDFSIHLKNFITSHSKFISYKEGQYAPGALVKKCLSHPLDIIFIDFSEGNLNLELLIEEIIYLKRISQLRSILFVALFKDDIQKSENLHLFTSGFQLSHVKGNEADTVLRDSFYIGFKKKIEFPVLALARKINLDLRIGICSTITAMNAEELQLETDIEGATENLNLQLPMFPDLKCESYEIKESLPAGNFYPMTCGYTIAYPYASAWADDTDKTIQPDTVETWFASYENEFIKTPVTKTKVLSNDLSLMGELFKSHDESIQIIFGEDTTNLNNEITNTKPALVFINLDDNIEGKINLELLNFLLQSELNPDYKPIVVVCNTTSTASALQKAFNYPMILSTNNKLDAVLFNALVKKFQNKLIADSPSVIPRFKSGSLWRQLDVFATFTLTSLTEHEVTFLSDVELPMFTVLHFNLPITFHATVVPAFFSLERKNNKNHYMAFIHGLTEEGLMVLRKFVNQIIYSPLKDFSPESVKKALGEALTNAEPVLIIPPQQEKKEEVAIAAQPVINKKVIFSGKSKL